MDRNDHGLRGWGDSNLGECHPRNQYSNTKRARTGNDIHSSRRRSNQYKGGKHVPITTREGAKCIVRMQVNDIRKPLMSVSKVCDAGHKVVFTSNGGYIEHTESGQVTNFERKRGVYVLNVKLDEHNSNPSNARNDHQDFR